MSYLVWAEWIAFIAVSFAIMEGSAIAHNRPTLSAAVWLWSKKFPLLPFLAGLLAGGLAVHWFWMGAPGLNCP